MFFLHFKVEMNAAEMDCGRHDQCDQMGGYFFKYLTNYNNAHLPNGINI